ncbi:hypothetical protein B0H13DRAFT_1880675 [Mycena leptocephala]|nr:hypothetical protein B0H13DRAFT_1888533 [Mycena leptocephala]KAJ7906362.1 hypothetical protein B0H13DRAFT_1880675 [Mycena leptocephala]
MSWRNEKRKEMVQQQSCRYQSDTREILKKQLCKPQQQTHGETGRQIKSLCQSVWVPSACAEPPGATWWLFRHALEIPPILVLPSQVRLLMSLWMGVWRADDAILEPPESHRRATKCGNGCGATGQRMPKEPPGGSRWLCTSSLLSGSIPQHSLLTKFFMSINMNLLKNTNCIESTALLGPFAAARAAHV